MRTTSGTRHHRWLTIPAVLLFIAALVRDPAALTGAIHLPALGLLPCVALAAHARSGGAAQRRALNAARLIAWGAMLWSLVVWWRWSFAMGSLAAISAVPALVAIGHDSDEENLAMATMWLAFVGSFGALALAGPWGTFAAAAVLLFLGGMVWSIEAGRDADVAVVLPEARALRRAVIH